MTEARTTDEQIAYLQGWAIANDCVFRDLHESTAGFGRPCVGISDGRSWVMYGTSSPERYYQEPAVLAKPPHAYHKDDCLCVLVNWEGADVADPRTTTRAEAISELYGWVRAIAEDGWVVRSAPRPNYSGSMLELALHGATQPVLAPRD